MNMSETELELLIGRSIQMSTVARTHLLVFECRRNNQSLNQFYFSLYPNCSINAHLFYRMFLNSHLSLLHKQMIESSILFQIELIS